MQGRKFTLTCALLTVMILAMAFVVPVSVSADSDNETNLRIHAPVLSPTLPLPPPTIPPPNLPQLWLKAELHGQANVLEGKVIIGALHSGDDDQNGRNNAVPSVDFTPPDPCITADITGHVSSEEGLHVTIGPFTFSPSRACSAGLQGMTVHVSIDVSTNELSLLAQPGTGPGNEWTGLAAINRCLLTSCVPIHFIFTTLFTKVISGIKLGDVQPICNPCLELAGSQVSVSAWSQIGPPPGSPGSDVLVTWTVTGATCSGGPTSNPCTFTMPTHSVTVSATLSFTG
jgi:hypothetical protein